MRTVHLVICLLLSQFTSSQGLPEKLSNAIRTLEKDPQFKHAAFSMYVSDATEKMVYAKNEEMGLAPASVQKIITSVAAFELLGNNYRYKTEIGYAGKDASGKVKYIYFKTSGDPTLGSWRFAGTKEVVFLARLKKALDSASINKMESLPFVVSSAPSQIIPNGWVWEDIGNYYGAGAGGVNWHENQYDILLSAGNDVGSLVSIENLKPAYTQLEFINELKAGSKQSGDNAYIFPALQDGKTYIRGTIPAGAKNFSISGAVPDPKSFFLSGINAYLQKNNFLMQKSLERKALLTQELLYTYLSPSFDSINYWFLKKSINLYGEAFVKTIATERGKEGSTAAGIDIIRDFFESKGIERSALKIIDGSGLSPANRVSTKALVQVLQYAKDKKWFPSFNHALPEMNGIKMKDGYIGGVRSYTGFIKSKSGQEYTFAFIINNFDGSPGAVREKMYKVLDLLK